MRRLLPLVLGLVLLGGCGGEDGETGGAHTETLPPGPQATDVCLGEHGFSIRPAASGVSAISPSGAELTIVFFDTEADASEAAGGADGSTAVANAVVTAEGKQLTSEELATVEDCVRGR
ncbi:MAG TPA: hypothetical protein VF044_01335 [Actinomycetota bacterium]